MFEEFKNQFLLSYPLKEHPLLSEKESIRYAYCVALKYFLLVFAATNPVANGVFTNYTSKICPDRDFTNLNSPQVCEKYVKKTFCYRFKNWKLVTYRYLLFIDVCFISAYSNSEKSVSVKNRIISVFAKRSQKKLNTIFDMLYKNTPINTKFYQTGYHLQCWKAIADFLQKPEIKVLVTANMSAGKSTLINALVGKKINLTRNEACTAKNHFIHNKPFEDNFLHEWDYVFSMNADNATLMDDDPQNTEPYIHVATHFNSEFCTKNRLCFIDTPGVNSALNKEHAELTKKTIKANDYDILLYILDATNLGTDDDDAYLDFIKKHAKDKKILFVINKFDKFSSEDDSVQESIKNVRKDLVAKGFKSPILCPVSSYAGFLAKMTLTNTPLTKQQERQYNLFKEMSLECFFDFVQYYDKSNYTAENSDINILHKFGILGLEQEINKGT